VGRAVLAAQVVPDVVVRRSGESQVAAIAWPNLSPMRERGIRLNPRLRFGLSWP
jgi:hypothetical protein